LLLGHYEEFLFTKEFVVAVKKISGKVWMEENETKKKQVREENSQTQVAPPPTI